MQTKFDHWWLRFRCVAIPILNDEAKSPKYLYFYIATFQPLLCYKDLLMNKLDFLPCSEQRKIILIFISPWWIKFGLNSSLNGSIQADSPPTIENELKVTTTVKPKAMHIVIFYRQQWFGVLLELKIHWKGTVQIILYLFQFQ